MNFEALPAQAALRRIVSEGIDPVLTSVGFSASRRRLTWVRSSDEVHHVIFVLRKRQFYDVQWGITVAGASEVLWGVPSDISDVGQAVMSGTPGSIRHPAPGQSWILESAIDQAALSKIVEAVRDDMQIVADRLVDFKTRRDVRKYLLQNREPIDDRDFVIPANLPLKLLTAATLALIDGDDEVCDLLPEVETQMAPFRDKLSHDRVARLRRGADELCS